MPRRVRRALPALLLLVMLPVPVAEGRTKRNWNLGDRAPLSSGMRGHDIRVLQDFLTKSGHTTRIDGHFGGRTSRSVRAFERAHRRRPDAVVTHPEIALLRRAASSGGAAAVQPSTPTQPATQAPALSPVSAPAGGKATIGPDGLAIAPADAPPEVKQIIAAGNAIARKPYRYGGGHGRWEDSGYDCSGSVSYALHGANLLPRALPSGAFAGWGEAGPGSWVTVYANAGHMYMVVAGLRYDTSARKRTGNRWTAEGRTTDGYAVRHPAGL